MAISKALRFQVFRRDGHTCQYCGGRPPDVALVIDHVVPIALGGSDGPENLVTSCRECNAGKSATPPDAGNVAAVGDRERRWRQALDEAAADAQVDRADIDGFEQEWLRYRVADTREPMPLPGNWFHSVRAWLRRGLTMDDLDHLMRVTMSRNMVPEDRFRYFAGCCWREVTRREEQASAAVED